VMLLVFKFVVGSTLILPTSQLRRSDPERCKVEGWYGVLALLSL